MTPIRSRILNPHTTTQKLAPLHTLHIHPILKYARKQQVRNNENKGGFPSGSHYTKLGWFLSLFINWLFHAFDESEFGGNRSIDNKRKWLSILFHVLMEWEMIEYPTLCIWAWFKKNDAVRIKWPTFSLLFLLWGVRHFYKWGNFLGPWPWDIDPSFLFIFKG